jgi:hypothetical protein
MAQCVAFSVEALSGIFDLNHAPFFQSFVEVRVERSKKRVVFSLNGVNGPLQCCKSAERYSRRYA